MVFSFQHYLSFVERFVENMLSRKCLMFNTSFIIFNNSTNPLQVRMSCLCFSTYSRQYDSAKPTNKQEDIQLKAVVLLLSCRIMTLLFSFAPYNLLKMVARNRAAPYEFIRKQRATIIGKPYNVVITVLFMPFPPLSAYAP